MTKIEERYTEKRKDERKTKTLTKYKIKRITLRHSIYLKVSTYS